MYILVFLLNFYLLLTKNKCTIPHKLWIICTLIPNLKNNVHPDTLNFLKYMLFSLTIYEKVNKSVDLHIQ